MRGVVAPQPDCRHCGAALNGWLDRCPRCGKRSWSNLFLRWMRRY